MSNELSPINVNDFDAQLAVAGKLIKTGFLPKAIDTPEKAVAIAMTGRELGIGMMLALQEINVIQGKPAASAKLQLALARHTKELENFVCNDDGNTATCIVQRKGQAPLTTTFSNADAKAMGLIGKDNWNKQPGNMRRWRAVSANLRLTFPDAIGGLYTPEEISPETIVDADGRVLEGLPAPAPTIRPAILTPMPKAAPAEIVAPVSRPAVVETPTPVETPSAGKKSAPFIVLTVDRKTKKAAKEGEADKVWYVIKAANDTQEIEATTYSETFAATASESKTTGFKVYIETIQKGKYLNIVSLEPAIEGEAAPTE